MPWGLIRLQQAQQLHFITFSCYRRQPFLETNHAKSVFENSLEQTRRSYRFRVIGYVVMPEHVHLLVTEPDRSNLATAIQALKQSVAQKLIGHHGRFWQTRYYDFNVCSPEKRMEKLKYIHRNPVTRGLVETPEHWRWSSYRHYATREPVAVEIESPWVAYLPASFR
jgi:putative transposase